MAAIAPELEAQPATTYVGRVSLTEGSTAAVSIGPRRLVCRRAASCLLRPAEGDEVLVAETRPGTGYVLAVLTAREETHIDVDGDLKVRAAEGKVEMTSRDGIDLLTPGPLSLAAGELRVTAERARAVVSKMTGLVEDLALEVTRGRFEGCQAEVVVGRLVQRVRYAFRRVEKLDQLDAERIDHKASETMTLRAGNAVVHAEQVVKVDGEQILMG